MAKILQHYCGWNEPCKSPYDDGFNCKCFGQYKCTARSRYREARCSITVGLGYIWEQPTFEEGHFVLETREEDKRR